MNRLPDRRTLTWRSWLQDMIADSYERVHIAGELGINPATLTRWAHNESHPRPLGRQAHVHGLCEIAQRDACRDHSSQQLRFGKRIDRCSRPEAHCFGTEEVRDRDGGSQK